MYIRTKDGVFEVTKDTKGRKFIVVGKNKTLLDYETFIHNESDIIDQSENLDELCDEFVIEYHNGSKIISIHDNTDDFLREHKFEIKSGYIKNVYGAIWTDKGLIYVAKMNQKGELCLL